MLTEWEMKVCLNYIDLFRQPFEEDKYSLNYDASVARLSSLNPTYPFLQCTTTILFRHAAKTDKEGISQILLINDFAVTSGCLTQMWAWYFSLISTSWDAGIGPGAPALNTASFFGLLSYVEILIGYNTDVQAKDSR